jgi:hypothetical protein
MKNTLLAVLVCWFVLPVLAQNKQWLRNIDSTMSRVYNLYYGQTPNIFYSLVGHRDFWGSTNNNMSYYRLNKFENDSLIQTRELFKLNKMVYHNNFFLNNKIDKHTIMSIEPINSDSMVHYIVYFNDTLAVDSFKIESPIRIGAVFCYMKKNDSLVIIHGDDFIVGGKVFILFTDSQGRYLSHRRIHEGNVIPGPVFSHWITMDPFNMIADAQGGYIVVGQRDSSGRDIKKHMFGLNALGEKTWEYFEPMAGHSYLLGAKLMPDGTILTWGTQWERMYIGSFTHTGVPIWQKMYYLGDNNTIGGARGILSDVQIIDDHMYAVGTTGQNQIGVDPYANIAVLMKLTPQGEVVWAKGFGNYHDNNILQHMLFLPPNKFMLGGFCIDSTLTPIHGVSWYVSTDTAANEELPWCRLPVNTLNYTSLNSLQNPECGNCIRVFPNPVCYQWHIAYRS